MKEAEKATQDHTAQPYEAPTLRAWGTVDDLTAVAAGNGGDAMEGSVPGPSSCSRPNSAAATGGSLCEVSY